MQTTVAAKSQRAGQKAETRERILRSALRLIEARGFAALRTPDVAAAAGISHASVFAHFGSRDELVWAAASSFLGDIDAATRKRLRESAGLEEFLRAHLAILARHESLYVRLLQDLHVLPKKARALVVEINSAVSSHLDVLLRRGGSPTPLSENERFFFFNAWIGLITHYLLNRDLFASGKNLLEEQGETMIRLFLKLTHQTKGK